MASTAKAVAGKDFILELGGKPFGCSQDATVNITTSVATTTGCREDAQAAGGTGNGLVPGSSKPTGYTWTVTPTALYRIPKTAADIPTVVTIPQLQIQMLAGDELEFSMSYTDTNGYSATYSGQCYITDSSLSGPLEGEATGSFTLTGTGALSIIEVMPTATV